MERTPPRARRRALTALAGAGALALACDAGGRSPETLPDGLRERVQELYERARDAGEDVPGDALEWAESDVRRIGDWEYRVVRLPAGPDAALEAELNALGEERWEVFWLEAASDGFRFFLKRPARSYLRMVPLGELGRLTPGSPE